MIKIINYQWTILKFKFYVLIYFIMTGKNYETGLKSYSNSDFKIRIISKAHDYAIKIANQEPLEYYFFKKGIKNIFNGQVYGK